MKKLISIRLSEDLHYELKLKTTKEKTSIQELIENFIKDYVKEENEKKKD
jgi:predicted HicB family RNase H-like nuclease